MTEIQTSSLWPALAESGAVQLVWAARLGRFRSLLHVTLLTSLLYSPTIICQHEWDLYFTSLSRDGKALVTNYEMNNVYAWDVHAICKEFGLADI
jgi:hypothetical protein